MNDSYFDLYILFHFIKKWKLNRSVHERRESNDLFSNGEISDEQLY